MATCYEEGPQSWLGGPQRTAEPCRHGLRGQSGHFLRLLPSLEGLTVATRRSPPLGLRIAFTVAVASARSKRPLFSQSSLRRSIAGEQLHAGGPKWAGQGRIAQPQDWGLETICARRAVASATNRSARVPGSPTSAGARPWLLAAICSSMLR